jgi:hypothetical protein
VPWPSTWDSSLMAAMANESLVLAYLNCFTSISCALRKGRSLL